MYLFAQHMYILFKDPTFKISYIAYKIFNILQLMTFEALDMMCYRPENTNIDRGKAEVNIGILGSISHHIQCLKSH